MRRWASRRPGNGWLPRLVAGAALLAWCAVPTAGRGSAAGPLAMPAGFEGVEPGMAVEELRQARPGAAAFDIFGEPETPTPDGVQMYLEIELDSPYFQQATYTFAREKLCTAQWLRAGDAAGSEEFRARLLQGSVRKWGEGYERVTYLEPKIPHVRRDRRKSAGLLWKLEGGEVLLRYSPPAGEEEEPGTPYMDVTIFDRECLPPPFDGWLEGVSPVADTAHDAWFTELKAEISPPLFD